MHFFSYLCTEISIRQKMKKILYTLILAIISVSALTSCDNTETYAEQKEREMGAINDYIIKHGIKVISENDFHANGDKTDLSRNEYVLFNSTGVYMQIIEQGCGEKLKNGESAEVLCRFKEYNVNGDSLQLTNMGILSDATLCDIMTVKNTTGTFNATFIKGRMMNCYGSSQVPGGWLVPLTYINLGRPQTEDEEIAHVRIIVPHDQGQAYATTSVYACEYDITYMRGK